MKFDISIDDIHRLCKIKIVDSRSICLQSKSNSGNNLIMEDKLIVAKTKLMAALADNPPTYLNNLKLWFKGKYTREEFDIASRKLLGLHQIHLHNQFFLAILNKVDALNEPQTSSPTNSAHFSTKSGKKRKRSSRLTDQATFEPVEIYDYLPDECSEFVRPPTIPGSSSSSPPPIPPQRFAVQELFLPDNGLIMGRLLVAAWETGGLVNADDSCCELIVPAVQLLLKNIITAVLLKKKSCRTTCGGTYFCDIGHPAKDITLRNTLARSKIDDTPIEIDRDIVCHRPNNSENSTFLSVCKELYPIRRKRITILDVHRALMDKNVIPNHSVHSINMERISHMLN